MNFQAIVENFAAMTCVVSVEKLPDGGCGEIRIVTGNQSYINSIEKPIGDVQMLTQKFVPNSLHTSYMTRDLNFESYCYGAAVEKRCLHSYAHPERFDVWFNMTFLPLGPDDGNLCYCTYTMEINSEPSSQRLSNVSGDLAAAILETTIKLRGARDYEAAMQDVVNDVLDLCGGEHIVLLQMDTYEKTCSVLSDAFAENTALRDRDSSKTEEFYEIAVSWEETIAGSNCLIVKNGHDMEVLRERNPRWHQSLIDAGIRTLALFPLKSGPELLGYMWISNFDPQQATRIKEALELTSFILGSEIGNRLLLDRLRIMGSRDMLTGVLNRNEMNLYVDRLSEEAAGSARSVGVLFADLNGLKTVNDELGHDKGDLMLRNAAKALCEVFDDEQIFRAGGDEFAVILTGITPEELQQKAAMVTEVSDRYQYVNFAIGCCYDDDSRNVRHALKIADQQMYEDKKKYYASHGIQKIR